MSSPFVVIWLAFEFIVPLVGISLSVFLWRRHHPCLAAGVIVTLVLIEANFSIVPYAIGLKNLFPVYRYVSSDGGFVGEECFKSTACYWSVLQEDWEKYKRAHPSAHLLRQEPIRLWEFWNWYDFATHPRWRLGYSADSGEGSHYR